MHRTPDRRPRRLPRVTSLLTALALTTLGLGVAQAQKPAQIAGPVESPYTLTAADGTGLALVALDARAVIDGPLAFTELRLTFENPHNRVIEGHFKVTMPDDAAISRFAMKIRGAWMEGEVVEKQAARRAYEDALHRRQDPALLEQDSGNTFRARVFPIQARERKELIISWSHELTRAGEAYRLPLKGLPTIESLNLTALTAGPAGSGPKTSLGGDSGRYQITKVTKDRFAPDQDWVVFGGEIPAGGDALRQDNLAVVRFPAPDAAGNADMDGAVVLFDSSASRVIDFEGRLAALRVLVGRLGGLGIGKVTVIAFDQAAERVYEGKPEGFGDSHLARLRDRGALGASSLEVGLDAVAFTEGKNRRLIVLSDGMITAGETERDAIRKRVSGLAGRGIRRVDAIVDTTARDGQMLEALVTADGVLPGKVIEGRDPLEQQLERLQRATLGDVSLTVAGANWVWPSSVRGLQGGDAVVAFVDLPAGAPLAVQLGGGATGTIQPATRDAEKPLLERAWVKARIERLEDMRSKSDPDLKSALKQQIITLSTRHRVLSTYTALVVLETENDYRRFGIERNALADILTVGPTGIELMARKGLAVAVRPPPPPPPLRRPTPRKRAMRARDGGPPGAPATASARRGSGGGGDGVVADRFGESGDADKDTRAEAPRMDDAPADAMGGAPPPAPEPEMAAAAAPPPSADMAEADEEAPMEMAKSEVAADEAPARANRRTRRRPAAIARPEPFPSRPSPRPAQIAQPTGESQGRRELREIEKAAPALIGEMAEIDKALARGKAKRALKKAKAWRAKDPTDLLALVALGRSYSMSGNGLEAARAFGSVLDLYPSRADMRRFAGNWLEQLGRPGLELAADNYLKALAQRPDHPSIYHLLAMVQLRLGQYDAALTTVIEGVTARRVQGRFAAVEQILMEDAQIIGSAWAAAEPGKRDEIEARLRAKGLQLDTRETMRFVLTWETDANDVDFHIFDQRFNHAYYSRRALATGGNLYADITTGYGPECFTIYEPGTFPYLLKAHYYSRGPMGHGAGKVQIIRHDGKGNVGIEDRPFVIMQDGAYVDLGKVTNKTARPTKRKKVIAR